MKQIYHYTALRISRCLTRPFVPITSGTTQTKVAKICLTARSLRDDVIDFESDTHERLMTATVSTIPFGFCQDLSAELGRNV